MREIANNYATIQRLTRVSIVRFDRLIIEVSLLGMTSVGNKNFVIVTPSV
jgi:hypothetical protein